MSAQAMGRDFELRTGRLQLRQLTLEDDAFVLRLLNDPAFVRYIGDKGVRDLEGARGYLRDGPLASYARYGFGLWRVGLPGGDTPIGMAGLLQRDYLPAPDIGYAFLPEYGGQGYAREAAAAVIDRARRALALPRLLAIVQDDNLRSIRLLETLGFAAQGPVRPPGTDTDLCLFAAQFLATDTAG